MTSLREPARVDRRAVIRTAVWTMPVVATVASAPAFAASCGSLTNGYLDWGANYTRASTSAGVASVPISGGDPVTATLAAQFTNYSPRTDNFAPTTAQVGGLGKVGFSLFQAVNSALYLNNPSYCQIVTITFSRKVYGLTFTLTDIDSATTDFLDAVTITSDGTFTVSGKGSGVTGGGKTTADPLKANGNNTKQNDSTSTGGNATVTFSTAATTVSLRYWSAMTTGIGAGIDPDQAIYVGPMSFQAYLTSGC